VYANIVIEDDVEESAVKMISPFDYKISAISCSARVFFHKSETFSHILQQAKQTEMIMIFTVMEIKTLTSKTLRLKACPLHSGG